MSKQKVDIFAKNLNEEVRKSVYNSSVAKTNARKNCMQAAFNGKEDSIRTLAGKIKDHALGHLDEYLLQATQNLQKNGVKVLFAQDAKEANKLVLDILNDKNAKTIVKAKSMATEEIELNEYLEKHGKKILETDLAEFVLQLDKDKPSHIVTPIVHKNRKQIATSFEKAGLGDYNDEPEVITRRARKFLREKFLTADCGITGANLLSAESGRLAIVTNEGNSRLSMAAPKLHIAVVGIEKIIPKDKDFSVFLELIARSATGQHLTSYTEFINGPKSPDNEYGSEEMVVIFLDNGRSKALGTDIWQIFRCLHCGACMNTCPVYRLVSGHAYRGIYPGPMGTIMTAALEGDNFKAYADLPKACTLCSSCANVCPAKIPLSDLILKLRDRAKKEHIHSPGTPPMGQFAILASIPFLWKLTMKLSFLANPFRKLIEKLPIIYIKDWTSSRTVPKLNGGKFRKWFKQRGNK